MLPPKEVTFLAQGRRFLAETPPLLSSLNLQYDNLIIQLVVNRFGETLYVILVPFLTGSDPEIVLEKRSKQEREESGVFQGAELSLSFDLLRIQWTVSPRLDAENLLGGQMPPV